MHKNTRSKLVSALFVSHSDDDYMSFLVLSQAIAGAFTQRNSQSKLQRIIRIAKAQPLKNYFQEIYIVAENIRKATVRELHKQRTQALQRQRASLRKLVEVSSLRSNRVLDRMIS